MFSNSSFGFESLVVWKKVRELKNEIIILTRGFPAAERFRLADQLIRSIRSVNALIAEGHGRYSWRDQLHYCIQARGSIAETVNHLFDAFDEGYISSEQLTELKIKAKEVEVLLNGYIAWLRKKKDEPL